MNMQTNATRARRNGYALLMVLTATGIASLVLAGTLNRSLTNAKMNDRSNEYSVASNAAEAAVEKVVARMGHDFQNYGPGAVAANINLYRNSIPDEDSFWTQFAFSDGQGNANRTYVTLLTNTFSGPLPSQYPGLSTMYAPIYRIISNARQATDGVVTGTAQVDVLLALVPLTHYAIFYNGLLEFSTCATMVVNGRVHANGSIYTGTSASLTFNGTVTSTGTISSPAWNGQGPRWNHKGTYNGTPPYRTNVPNVSLEIGMTNVHDMLEMPPNGLSPLSYDGRSRFFNKAQTALIITNNSVMMKLQQSINYEVPGADPNPLYLTSNITPTALATNFPFLTTDKTFTDQRENKTVKVTEIDVGRYKQWIQTNVAIQSKFPAANGAYPTILYVADNRTVTSSQMNAVRLTNGDSLPENGGLGWSVATPNPLYMHGHYNCPNAAYRGTTNTTASVPAAIMSDALTILSPTWLDSKSSSRYTTRVPSSTTVNAAILTGTVPSTGPSASQFSGGVHNLPRLLEDWNVGGSVLTLNTAILKLFNSEVATRQFVNPGTYYDPPTRNFSYDLNYLDPYKQPPGIPCAMVLIRLNWAAPPPNTVTYNVAP